MEDTTKPATPAKDKPAKRAACTECGKRRVIVKANSDGDFAACKPCWNEEQLAMGAEIESLNGRALDACPYDHCGPRCDCANAEAAAEEAEAAEAAQWGRW